MDLEEVKVFFKLEGNPDLFQLALSPPSCGGGAEFKTMALKGDKILDSALIRIFNLQNIKDSGVITLKKALFHNDRTLPLVADYLGLQAFMKPTDASYQIQKSDLKEALEALLAASESQNGPEVAFAIVQTLYLLALEKDFMDFDYISELNLLLQTEGNNIGSFWTPPVKVGGLDHLPLWKIHIRVPYGGETFEAESESFNNTTDAKRDVARKILSRILGKPFPVSAPLLHSKKIQVEKRAVQSIAARQIIFTKLDAEEGDEGSDALKVSTNTGESLLTWAMEKAQENPYGTLLILSSLLTEIRGASWCATTDFGELILLNLKIEGNHFFEIGYGLSRSKARKEAANRIINTSKLWSWLAQKYKNKTK